MENLSNNAYFSIPSLNDQKKELPCQTPHPTPNQSPSKNRLPKTNINIETQDSNDAVESNEHIHNETNCGCQHDHDHDQGKGNKNEQSLKSLADQMLDNSGNVTNKSYKKLMKQVQKDPKLRELINYFQKNPVVMQKKPQTARERLRARIEEQNLRRAGPKAQQVHRERLAEMQKKKVEDAKKNQKTEEQVKAELKNTTQEKITASIQEAKKREKHQRSKLNKLQKKYGQISFERYSEALKFMSNLPESVKQEEVNREKNIIDLYLKQNPTVSEKQLDLYEEELSDLEIEDLEDLEN